MSVTGSIYKVSNKELETYQSKISWNPIVENKPVFLDSFFYDIYEVLTKYSDFSEVEISPVIEGKNIIRKDEATIGYSLQSEVKALNELLPTVTEERFVDYFKQAMSDRASYVYAYKDQEIYVEGVVNYFNQLKAYFSGAANDHKCLLHIIG